MGRLGAPSNPLARSIAKSAAAKSAHSAEQPPMASCGDRKREGLRPAATSRRYGRLRTGRADSATRSRGLEPLGAVKCRSAREVLSGMRRARDWNERFGTIVSEIE